MLIDYEEFARRGDALRRRIAAACRQAKREPGEVQLLAVTKTHGAAAVDYVARYGLHAVGENRVQEAAEKRGDASAAALALRWELIGHLQSNKAREAAVLFDWIQTVDRPKLVAALAQHRPMSAPPLNVLIQVNIDDEASKHGCRPEDITSLSAAIDAEPRLMLRGLMAIPAPSPDPAHRRTSFGRMKSLFDALAARYPQVDTLSMGMSDDIEPAIEEGATMVRVGTALFGARPPTREDA